MQIVDRLGEQLCRVLPFAPWAIVRANDENFIHSYVERARAERIRQFIYESEGDFVDFWILRTPTAAIYVFVVGELPGCFVELGIMREQFAGVAMQSFVLVTQRDELAADLVAFSINDDGMVIWLKDRSQAAADFAKRFLLSYSGTGNDISGAPTRLAQIYPWRGRHLGQFSGTRVEPQPSPCPQYRYSKPGPEQPVPDGASDKPRR